MCAEMTTTYKMWFDEWKCAVTGYISQDWWFINGGSN